ncbi:MAG: sugar-binding protein [Prevotellaceae bacterium]|jgi:putative multiple sugar transport system substrate-binding protein|nr:sugar-binding protein [Prevotellaceae bacterium]
MKMKSVLQKAGLAGMLAAAFMLGACDSDKDEAKWKVGIALSNYESGDRWAADGANMVKMLEQYGFDVNLQHVERDVTQQKSQIEDLINAGCKVLIITAVDSNTLGDVLEKAAGAGIKVIAYDRLLMNTNAVDYYVTFDNEMAGMQQGQYIVDHLPEDITEATRHIELFTGPFDDNNVNFFFGGALKALDIDNNNIAVLSGEKSMNECSIADWSTVGAKERMKRLISTYGYAPGGTKLDAVLCSNDDLAEGVVDALTEAGYTAADMPVVTGQDAEVDALKRIIAGTQSMTVFKDTRLSAEATVEVVRAIRDNAESSLTFGTPYNNGKKEVKTLSCETTVVNKDNYRQILIDSGYYTDADLQ